MTVTVNKLKSKTAQPKITTSEFNQVFQDHWSRVYGVVYHIVGDPAEADDLALETFIRLHQHPPRDRTNLTGWLYRVATNLALNALRSQKRRGGYESKSGLITLEGAAVTDPSKVVERAEDRCRVRQVLSKMNKRSANMLILRHYGFSYTEIAGIVGVSASSVGTLLARAEREFEKRYQDSTE